MAEEQREEEALPAHHVKVGPCFYRKRYRDGRRKVAVKAYGVFCESRHLLLFNVPSIGVERELETRLTDIGRLDGCVQWLHDGPGPIEPFTSTAHACYERMTSARLAKRRLDDFSFFGSVLHVSYAPEFESVSECRLKLFLFRKFVTSKYRRFVQETTQRLTQNANKEKEEGEAADVAEIEAVNEEQQQQQQQPKKLTIGPQQPAIILPDLRFPPPALPVCLETETKTETPAPAAPPDRLEGEESAPPERLSAAAAFGSSVLVLRAPTTARPRFRPRQVEPPAKKARREEEATAGITVGDLKKAAVALGKEQGPQIDAERLAALRAHSSVTFDPELDRSRKEITRKLRDAVE